MSSLRSSKDRREGQDLIPGTLKFISGEEKVGLGLRDNRITTMVDGQSSCVRRLFQGRS